MHLLSFPWRTSKRVAPFTMNCGDGESSCKQGAELKLVGIKGGGRGRGGRREVEEAGCEERRVKKKDRDRCPIKLI